MTDLASAAGDALASSGSYVAVTGRTWVGAEGLIERASLHLVAPGPGTRLAVAAGVALGGRRAAAVVDGRLGPAEDGEAVLFTLSVTTAASALGNGWSVVQARAAEDLAALLEAAPRPTLVLLRQPAGTGEGGPEPGELADPPRPAPLRHWADGELVTIAASGAAVGPMLHLARRLRARGVEPAIVEVAVLTGAHQAALLGGDRLLVGPREGLAAPPPSEDRAAVMHTVALDGLSDADLVGEVLAHVPAARS